MTQYEVVSWHSNRRGQAWVSSHISDGLRTLCGVSLKNMTFGHRDIGPFSDKHSMVLCERCRLIYGKKSKSNNPYWKEKYLGKGLKHAPEG